jgi:diguanylate cyclase (GGDEF)-like protein
MNIEVIHILLVEDNPGDARLLSEELREINQGSFEVARAETLAAALEHLEGRAADAVLLDLDLPDSAGLATLEALRKDHPTVPVVVLSGLADEVTALDAVNAGAQDFIIKGRSDPGNMLMRAIVYAIERSRMIDKLRSLALTDDLTQLYNRRGFETLADQHLRLARRNRQDFAIFFADIDELKAVNDRLGHAAGDRAIQQTAEILRANFRESDIIARMGGDEFVVLAIDCTEEGAAALATRIQESLVTPPGDEGEDFELALSVGTKCFESSNDSPIAELLDRADAALYQMKRERKAGS